ncbi:bilirubin oxidase precursor [Auricularia subglabra TFB-10046 SS5]|uniref:Bilirubin oxidase n=1 Tax=Auricularia subglabra (strain TFB-10046 / SS5) TaxID=717982 RepID=J0LI23_AURST|nr:bilirubin oxidase precursor [Auricularia subglabra TFB-10046 SS5]
MSPSFALLGVLLPVAVLSLVTTRSDDDWDSPVYTDIFEHPLPIPAVAQPIATYTNSTTGNVIDYYEMTIEKFALQTYPASQGFQATNYVGYNGTAPGPTFRMTKGREAVVRFINLNDRPSVIHLHGSFSRAPFDGWAEDTLPPNTHKDYYYPNRQNARTLWYHDHAIGITAVNAYFGQAGFYILDDPEEDARLGLPQGEYDIPLMLAGKQFLPSGQLLSPEEERVSLYGDVMTVNAQPWPFLQVEPRKYRFRLLDASVSRTFKLYMVASSNPKQRITFSVIGSDSGLVSSTANTTSLVIAMAERWDIVVDFAPFVGQNITIMNERDFQTNPDYAASDRIMQFRVGTTVTSQANNNLPSTLRTLPLPEPKAEIDHEFTFERKHGMWLINGVGFEDIPNRILAKPERGNTEQWTLENKSGGWSHPIHVHLVDFQIVSRSSGRVENYERVALKDVVYLEENEKVNVIARYAPWDGVYMFHCHNLVHEDHDMMAAFNVTDLLSDFGYTDTARLGDPLDARFRSKPGVGPFDLNTVLTADIPTLDSLNAYADVEEVEEALTQYWSTHTA